MRINDKLSRYTHRIHAHQALLLVLLLTGPHQGFSQVQVPHSRIDRLTDDLELGKITITAIETDLVLRLQLPSYSTEYLTNYIPTHRTEKAWY